MNMWVTVLKKTVCIVPLRQGKHVHVSSGHAERDNGKKMP